MLGPRRRDLLLDVGDQLLRAVGLTERLAGDPGLLLPGGAKTATATGRTTAVVDVRRASDRESNMVLFYLRAALPN